MAHQAGAYPGFCSMKRLGVFLLSLDGMLVHRRLLPGNFCQVSQQIADTHLYTWVERGTVRVKCLAQEHNTMSRPGLEPGPLAPESSALTPTAPPTRSTKYNDVLQSSFFNKFAKDTPPKINNFLGKRKSFS